MTCGEIFSSITVYELETVHERHKGFKLLDQCWFGYQDIQLQQPKHPFIYHWKTDVTKIQNQRHFQQCYREL